MITGNPCTVLLNIAYSILKTLHEYIIKRTRVLGCESCMEKIEWDQFWKEWKGKLLLYACACGTVGAVKLLIDMGCEPDTW